MYNAGWREFRIPRWLVPASPVWNRTPGELDHVHSQSGRLYSEIAGLQKYEARD